MPVLHAFCITNIQNYFILRDNWSVFIFERCLCAHKLPEKGQFAYPKTLENVPDGHILQSTMNRKDFIKFRCSPLEKAIIEKNAQNCGLSVSAYIRTTSLNRAISYKMTAEEVDIFNMLKKYHNNFTAISNLHKIRDPSVSNLTKELANEIKQIIKKIQ